VRSWAPGGIDDDPRRISFAGVPARFRLQPVARPVAPDAGDGHASSDRASASDGASMGAGRTRCLLVVSHPAVVNVNQEVYRELARRGWEVTIVVPKRWRHEYAGNAVAPHALDGMEDALRPTSVAFAGRPQRHLYLTSCRALLRQVRPDVAFLEAEPYALSAAQWGFALTRAGVPFGVQCYENIDRHLPAAVRWLRTRVLRDCAFVAARSETAGELVRAWGARGEIGLAPPAVPGWDSVPKAAARPFTVGYAGRLVSSKGLADLLAAVRSLAAPVELILIGDGEMREEFEAQPIPGSQVRILSGLSHDQMASGYAQLDVLVLPSHTTPTWKEQFGRVIIEALWCGVPVVGSDSGEIPWLIGLTGGGLVFPEGDAETLASRLTELRSSPELGRRLARTGRAAVERLFTVSAATDPLERMLSHATAAHASLE
jgi:glycosyltransferase involved in cell wall biosynthesis